MNRQMMRQHTVALGQRLLHALQAALSACDRLEAEAEQTWNSTRKRLRAQQAQAQRDAQARYQPILEKIQQTRTQELAQLERTHHERTEAIRQRKDADRAAAESDYQMRLQECTDRYDRTLAQAEAHFAAQIDQATQARDQAWHQLEADWHHGLERLAQVWDEMQRWEQTWFPPWTDPVWNDRPPAREAPLGIPLGHLTIDLALLEYGLPKDERLTPRVPTCVTVPAWLGFPTKCALLLKTRDQGRQRAVEALQSIALRFLTAVPPGKVRFTIIDPVGLGENFASFMGLADHDENLVGARIWTEPEQIERRLADLTAHMENVIQKYLRNQYKSIEEYNRHAGEVAEPFRVLVIANFPTNFTPEAARRLVSIVSSGSACGVYTLLSVDSRVPLPQGFNLSDLEAASLTLVGKDDAFVAKDAELAKYPLRLEAAPSPTLVAQLVQRIGAQARDANRVEVPFDFIMPPADQIWTHDSRKGITVPLGRAGATRKQALRLGVGTAQHVLIAGKTGSGKSTLLHALITNLALHYAPDEVELYLIDFKKGVEFKAYAAQQLPHARVIAIESEREFGLSVLQRLDAELRDRGEKFREAGTNDLAGYRNAFPDRKMPRILLIVDEFQEFFVEEDKLSQEAALLLDRLVRQGRAFGLHVLLGSQTLGGAYSLARSTIDQMAVRIALQCSDADAQLILSKDNHAARLLSRPGEAIYNDANGLVEGNDPFQVVWLSDRRREELLSELRQRAAGLSRPAALVFEGNAAACLERDPCFVQPPALRGHPPYSASLGEAIAIKEPTSAVFRPIGGHHLLMIGQHEELARQILTSAMLSLAMQLPSVGDRAGRFVVLDGSDEDDPQWGGYLGRIARLLPHPVTVPQSSERTATLAELADAVRRHVKQAPTFVLILGLNRFRELRKADDDFGFRRGEKPLTAADHFQTLLREGPLGGVHLLMSCDTLPNLTRILDRQAQRDCSMRILFQMSAADSSQLIDSPAASRLGRYRALFVQEDQPQPEKFRPYALPTEALVQQLLARRRETLTQPIDAPAT